MKIRWPLSLGRGTVKSEQRAVGGYTAQIMALRAAEIQGRTGLGELTATVQACIGLWEMGLSMAAVDGTDALTPATLALIARSLGTRGECVYLIADDWLIPASDWDITTRDGVPRAYRLTIPDTAGGRNTNALAAEVIHIRTGVDPAAPWRGTPPLRRAGLTAGLLHAVESALQDVYQQAPLGSQVVPMPENPAVDNEALARSFRGQRGRVLLRESVSVTAGGGPVPQTDWRPSDLSPDLSKSMTAESWDRARNAIMAVYGVLPVLLDAQAAGPAIREGQRHLAMWQLQPLAGLVAQEATAKLGVPVTIDTLQPIQAYDAGGRARALSGVIEALARAKEAGLPADQVAAALKFSGTTME